MICIVDIKVIFLLISRAIDFDVSLYNIRNRVLTRHIDDEEEPAPKKAPSASTSIDIHLNSESSSDDDDDAEHASGEKAPTQDETYAKLGMV